MKYIFFVLIILSPLLAVASDISTSLSSPPVPSIKASVKDFILYKSKKNSIKFNLELAVPADHHIYMNKGKNGYYIPLSFDFSDFILAGYDVTQNKGSAGEYDKVVEALVLRRKGEFSFLLERKKRLPAKKNMSFSIIYQICDDVAGICYPPQSMDINPAAKNIKP